MSYQINPNAALAQAAAHVLSKGNLIPAIKAQVVHTWAEHMKALLKNGK